MPTKSASQSPLSLVAAALLTFGFVGCLGETRSLNTDPGANGGEEGDPSAGTGGANAGKAGHIGKATGGTSSVGGSAGSGVGALGGSSFAGSSEVGGSSGAPFGGMPNGGVGASAGFSGDAGSGAGPVGGSAGGAGYPGCVVSEDSGCDGRGFCVDHELDACVPDFDTGCSGTCAVPYLTPVCSGFGAEECPFGFTCLPDTDTLAGTDPVSICVGGPIPSCDLEGALCAEGFACLDTGDGRQCVPDRAQCIDFGPCSSIQVPKCPAGFAAADAQACDYVCLPIQHCGCDADGDCPEGSSCDREMGRCLVPQAPAPRCSEPWDAGVCNAAFPAFAFVDGECQAVTYGGCGGNDNRFATLAECEGACEGRPIEHACTDGRVEDIGCLACGAGGGCMTYGTSCFEPCETSDDCTDVGFSCVVGICQASPCV